MKKSRAFRFALGGAALCAAMAVGLAQAPPAKSAPKAPAAPEKDRGQILKETEAAAEAYQKDPKNAETAFKLATLLYQAGDFEKAGTIVKTLLDTPKPSSDALFLWADIEYLLARYEQAETALRKILALEPASTSVQVRAQTKLVFVYYQTNRFAKSADLYKGLEGKIKMPYWELMKSFGAEKPYQITWPAGSSETKVPFIVTDPLPVVSVEIQGRPIYALIDTGADTFVLDTETASALKIKPLASMTGTFAGGKQAEVGFGRAETLKLGSVVVRAVPISILPTKRFSQGFAGGKYPIEGIVGTGLLKQFLPTLDYPRNALVLRRPGEDGRRILLQAPKGKTAVEVPFTLAMTHFMLARGLLNAKDGLVFFVDSGLASEAAFTAPVQTLRFAGIPVPEIAVQPGSIGGGGGAGFATGIFPIKKLGLGLLIQEDKKGEFGVTPPESYWRLGFIEDGLISHQFLRVYAWTIDFRRMRMIFVK